MRSVFLLKVRLDFIFELTVDSFLSSFLLRLFALLSSGPAFRYIFCLLRRKRMPLQSGLTSLFDIRLSTFTLPCNKPSNTSLQKIRTFKKSSIYTGRLLFRTGLKVLRHCARSFLSNRFPSNRARHVL